MALVIPSQECGWPYYRKQVTQPIVLFPFGIKEVFMKYLPGSAGSINTSILLLNMFKYRGLITYYFPSFSSRKS